MAAVEEHLATVTAIMQAIRKVDPTSVSPEVPELETKAVKELTPDIMRAIEAFKAAKEMKRYADGQKDLWEAVIREALEGAEIGTVDGKPVIKRNHSHTTFYSAAILRDAYPEAAEAAEKRTDYDYLVVV